MSTHEKVGAGRTRVSDVVVDPGSVRALAALFDDGRPAPAPGDILPALWHWVALPTWDGASSTGPDGHPRAGTFLPDVGRPRRMFAGGRVRYLEPLRVGDEVRREERIISVTPKSGRQGDFTLVKVEVRISVAGRTALVETQDIVYRDTGQPTAPSPQPATQPQDVAPALLSRVGSAWTLRTDPTKLMRFSAATSNAHRIHYDHPYATQVECYPGLVVHGPLMTLALAEVLRLERYAPLLRELSHRNLRPLFCGEQAHIDVRTAEDGAVELSLARTTDAPNSLLTAWTA